MRHVIEYSPISAYLEYIGECIIQQINRGPVMNVEKNTGNNSRFKNNLNVI